MVKKNYTPVDALYELQSFCMLSDDKSRCFFSIRLTSDVRDIINSSMTPLKLQCSIRSEYPEVVRIKVVEDKSEVK